MIRSIEDWVFWLGRNGIDAMFWPQPLQFPCIGLLKNLRSVPLPTQSDVIIEYVYPHDFT